MENQPSLVSQVEFIVVSRKIRILGMAIMFGVTAIFLAGLFLGGNNSNPDLAMLNIISVIACSAFCIGSVYIKKMLNRSLTPANFKTKYVSSSIVAFALCDGGGIFCIATNLFINTNVIYAAFGLLITLLYLFINMPKESDLNDLNVIGRVQSPQ